LTGEVRAPKAPRERVGRRWMMLLSGLKTLLETGKPLADG
jgi:hypothetical protein